MEPRTLGGLIVLVVIALVVAAKIYKARARETVIDERGTIHMRIEKARKDAIERGRLEAERLRGDGSGPS